MRQAKRIALGFSPLIRRQDSGQYSTHSAIRVVTCSAVTLMRMQFSSWDANRIWRTLATQRRVSFTIPLSYSNTSIILQSPIATVAMLRHRSSSPPRATAAACVRQRNARQAWHLTRAPRAKRLCNNSRNADLCLQCRRCRLRRRKCCVRWRALRAQPVRRLAAMKTSTTNLPLLEQWDRSHRQDR